MPDGKAHKRHEAATEGTVPHPKPSQNLNLSIEVDAEDDLGDDDAGFDAAPTESLDSLKLSIFAYQEENGRTYHAKSAGKYPLPNDEPENDRLNMFHHLMTLTLDNQLCISPKRLGANRVLDMGTGTGIWSIDYADAHPEADVTGVDLSPIQPTFVPPNVSFEIDDMEHDWTWADKFDFIFCRSMVASFKNWEEILAKAFENLEPGGYLELQDNLFPLFCEDDTMPPGTPVRVWTEDLMKAADIMERPLDTAAQFKSLLEKAGFEDVVEKKYKWPINPWPDDPKLKELGLWTYGCLDQGLEGLTMALFQRGLHRSMEETTTFCSKVRKDLGDINIHAYFPVYVAYGRKPLDT